ncbi:MAG: 50S ribosomal protein L29 [Chitinophagales bacterium]|jgi:large subunit ribosomal protein L29|nr:50S ribosomal protein L29 [Chitinophagales bacterium]HNL06728.1 50S ribosomal protein L29 [Chitinophagales bacterium]
MATKKNTKPDLKSFSTDELLEQVYATEMQLQKARFSHAVSLLSNPSVMRKLRKDIARLKTELRAREIAETVDNG